MQLLRFLHLSLRKAHFGQCQTGGTAQWIQVHRPLQLGGCLLVLAVLRQGHALGDMRRSEIAVGRDALAGANSAAF